ncbi:MAG TPA: hypothetical protein VNM45_11090 [Bacillus sp. (in: firmicutes)]|nr:hypothetical protein [Bacillus sp. (in: firmicutes)]
MKNQQKPHMIVIGICTAILTLFNAYVSYPDSSAMSTFFLVIAGLFLLVINIRSCIVYKK